ncbi:MAG: tryptophan-rich sensory protein [Oscillospiraceae bacterium]|nr:tryptophan-rich sensory protein [Oscillospiraceae bacterium]
MKKHLSLIVSVIIPLAVGAVSALLVPSFSAVYASLPKPPLAPPSVLFPIVWTVLYILMGAAAWLVWRGRSPARFPAITAYAVQLLMNFLWVLVFFGAGKLFSAFIWVIGLFIAELLTFFRFKKIDRTAGALLIPLLVWTLFGAYLNLAIYILPR